jgi:hypothetical protein
VRKKRPSPVSAKTVPALYLLSFCGGWGQVLFIKVPSKLLSAWKLLFTWISIRLGVSAYKKSALAAMESTR